MMDIFVENIKSFGPIVGLVWLVTLVCVLRWPQRYLNSFLLMIALLMTMLFLSGFFGEGRGIFLLVCFLLVMLALFSVPVLLIINGIQMLKRESLHPAHVLSLALGIVVGIGELATVGYVIRLAGFHAMPVSDYGMLLVSMTVFYFSFLVLSFVLYTVFIQLMPHRMDFDYVIIHGCGLQNGERLTRLLADRVDKAIEIYQKCKQKPIIIPSGGQGPDEKRSEAAAMAEYLLAHGIPESHILLEDASTTTRENLLNSKNLIESREGRKKTALVSSNYHIYRCLRLAKEVGLTCTGLGARVAFYYWPSALIREFIAIFLKKRFLIWSLLGYLVFISPILYFFLVG